MQENEIDILLERLEALAKEYFKFKYTKSEQDAIKNIILELNGFKREIITIKKKDDKSMTDDLKLDKIKEVINFGEETCRKLGEVKTPK